MITLAIFDAQEFFQWFVDNANYFLSIFDAQKFFKWFVENANYIFVFVFMVIESSFIPFP